MKNKLISIIVTLLLVCHAAYADKSISKTLWEYKTWVTFTPQNLREGSTAFQESLNRFGKDGWELVSVATLNGGSKKSSEMIAHYFKRAIKLRPTTTRKRFVPKKK